MFFVCGNCECSPCECDKNGKIKEEEFVVSKDANYFGG